MDVDKVEMRLMIKSMMMMPMMVKSMMMAVLTKIFPKNALLGLNDPKPQDSSESGSPTHLGSLGTLIDTIF